MKVKFILNSLKYIYQMTWNAGLINANNAHGETSFN